MPDKNLPPLKFLPSLPPQEVERWMRRLRNVMQDQPASVWLYVASGTLHVMAKTEDGKRLMNQGGESPGFSALADVGSIKTGEIDGGDW